MARPALLVVSKVLVENLPQAPESTGLFKIKFRCGTGAAETAPHRADADGSAEWTVPLEMTVPDADMPLVAVVMQQLKLSDSGGRGWTMVPGARFPGPAASALPPRWLQTSPGPVGVRFAADVEVFLDGIEESDAQVWQQAELPAAFDDADDAAAGPDQRIFQSSGPASTPSWLVEPGVEQDGRLPRQGPGMFRSQSDGPTEQERGIVGLAGLGLRTVQNLQHQVPFAEAGRRRGRGPFSWGAGAPAWGGRIVTEMQQQDARGEQPMDWRRWSRNTSGFNRTYPYSEASGTRAQQQELERDKAARGAQIPPTVGVFDRPRQEGRQDDTLFPPPVAAFTSSRHLGDRLAQHSEHDVPPRYPPPLGSFARSRLLDRTAPLEEYGASSAREGRVREGWLADAVYQSAGSTESAELEEFKDAQPWGVHESGAIAPPGAVPGPLPPPQASPIYGALRRIGSILRAARSFDTRLREQNQGHDSSRDGELGFERVEESHSLPQMSDTGERVSGDRYTTSNVRDSGDQPQTTETLSSRRRTSSLVTATATATPASRRAERSLFVGRAPERMKRSASARTALATVHHSSLSATRRGSAPAATPAADVIVPRSVGSPVAAAGSDASAVQLEETPGWGDELERVTTRSVETAVWRRADATVSVDEANDSTVARVARPEKPRMRYQEKAKLEPAGFLEPAFDKSIKIKIKSQVTLGARFPSSPCLQTPVRSSLGLGDGSSRLDLPGVRRQSAKVETAPPKVAVTTPAPTRRLHLLGVRPQSAEVESASPKVAVTTPAQQQGAFVAPTAQEDAPLRRRRRLSALSHETYDDEVDDDLDYATGAALGPTELQEKGQDRDGYMRMPEDALISLALERNSVTPAEPTGPSPPDDARRAPFTPIRESNGEPEGSGPKPTERFVAAQREPTMRSPARPAAKSSTGAGVLGVDPVCFSCFSPPTVSEGQAFPLKVTAYLKQQRDNVLREAIKAGVAEAGIPGAMPIMRGRRVTVKLDLPADIFEVMLADGNKTSRGSYPPGVRDFVWTGDAAHAEFKVGCKPGALAAASSTGHVQCGADIIEGSRVMRLSFKIELARAGEGVRLVSDGSAQELDTRMEEVRAGVARIAQEELTFEGTLGNGIQGTTFSGRWKGKRVAIKRLAEPLSSSHLPAPAVSELEHEATILSLLGHHPNIVQFYGLSTGGGGNGAGSDSLDVVTKLEEGGSLAQLLGTVHNNNNWRPKQRNGSGGWFGFAARKPAPAITGTALYDGRARSIWARDVACGLANAHAAGVVHNDVACRNALLSHKGPEGTAMLCDFGMSTLLRGGVEWATLIDVENGGSGRWPIRQMPPEALNPPHALSPSSDTYMFGTMLYELFAGERPFADLDNGEVVRLVREGKTLKPPPLLEQQGPTLKKVFDDCLMADPLNRPTMEEVVARLSFDSSSATVASW